MSITERIYLKNWYYDEPDRVKLVYSDDEIVFVTREDFNRAFGAIINADGHVDHQRQHRPCRNPEIFRDFAIEA